MYSEWYDADVDYWPSSEQREFAQWLIAQGADMIVGHHPHVIQEAECVDGRPVVYSLGNHVFDQKYPLTKQGRLLSCLPSSAGLDCAFHRTEIPPSSSFPRSMTLEKTSKVFWETCPVKAHDSVHVDTTRVSVVTNRRAISINVMQLSLKKENNSPITLPAPRLLGITSARLETKRQEEYLLTLQSQYSAIDKETAPRPYVYAIGPHGLIAKWRGSALAWPLLNITTLPQGAHDFLCALHRGDSFIDPDPTTHLTRSQVYQWNGFGFAAIEDPKLIERCIASNAVVQPPK